MSNTIFLTLIFSVILAVMLFSGMVKTVKFTFGQNPTEDAYQSENVRKVQSEATAELAEKNRIFMDKANEEEIIGRTQSEKTADLAEKNRQNMDRLRAQMERNQR